MAAAAMAAALLCLARPASAATALLVNNEGFETIDDADVGANTELRFGYTLTARLAFDRANNRFDFNRSLYVRGNLTLTGSLKLTAVTSSGGVAYASGSELRFMPTGGSGQVLLSRGTASPTWGTPTAGMVWYLDGTQSVANSVGAQVTMPFTLALSGVTMNIKGAPTGAAFIVDIRKDGTTIFSTRPQINASATTGGGNAVLSTFTLPRNAVISLDVTQVGSVFAGSGATVILNGIRRY